MAKVYKTVQGDTVDLIAHKEYGYSRGSAEQIYKANEFILLEQSYLLEPDIELILPDIKNSNKARTLNTLWE